MLRAAWQDVAMDFGLKRALHLAGAARKLDHCAPGGNAVDSEAMRFEPVFDGLHILIGGTKLGTELSGREPVVIIRRVAVLLLREERFERGFLLRAALEQQQDVLHREAGGSKAAVEFGARERIDVAAQYDANRIIHPLRDAGRDRCDLSGGVRRAQKREKSNDDQRLRRGKVPYSHGVSPMLTKCRKDGYSEKWQRAGVLGIRSSQPSAYGRRVEVPGFWRLEARLGTRMRRFWARKRAKNCANGRDGTFRP